ncbi:hypothetical protein [Paraburkholderia sp. D1E]|uniref:hypothetical protein n=1 Tax=Paraburkholderia sp. D1E TaxID=3461398 RepID=UPI00404653ED
MCFSEIRAGQWSRLEERRETKYGVAFTKEFILSQGGGPIWYAWKNTPHWRALQRMMASSIDDADADVWKICPMIDAPGHYGRSDYVFDWEREWRHVGSMRFDTNNVAFLLMPEQLHGAARGFVENAFTENIGPAYFCPYVDPAWEKDAVLDALRR